MTLSSLFVGPSTIVLDFDTPDIRGQTAILWVLAGIGVLYLGLAVVRVMIGPSKPARLRRVRDLGIGVVVVGGPLAVIAGVAPLTTAAAVWLLPAMAFLFDRRFFLPFPRSVEDDDGPLLRTRFLNVVLDGETEALDGEVIQGRFAGRRLSDLSPDELDALMGEVTSDPESANILMRIFPQFHHGAGHEDEGTRSRAGRGQRRHAGAGGRYRGERRGITMDAVEAYKVLDIAPGASDADILKAHRRLMKLVHPDRGGSAYFASKLNEARDLLLNR